MPTVRRRHEPSPPADSRGVLLENVLESLGDAVILTDEEDRVRLVNQAAEELLGVAEAQILGRACRSVFARSPWLAELIERTRQTAQNQARAEEILEAPPREITVRASCSPIFGTAGVMQGAALVIYDLSYQKMLEDEMRRNESLARLGTLVAGLAHEVKNPLGGIKGAAQLMARRLAGDPEVRSCTDIIVKETDRLSALVEQLLVFGSPRKPELLPLNVHHLLRHVLDLMAPIAQEKGIGIRFEIDPSLPDVAGDEAQLSQLFLNLVKNAFEAMSGGGGMLTITTRLDTDIRILRRPAEGQVSTSHAGAAAQFVRVSFADNGPGFPPDQLTHLFEPFVTTKPRGTGLGLAICRRIVAGHHGDIRAENRPGGGALLTVTLPWARGAA